MPLSSQSGAKADRTHRKKLSDAAPADWVSTSRAIRSSSPSGGSRPRARIAMRTSAVEIVPVPLRSWKRQHGRSSENRASPLSKATMSTYKKSVRLGELLDLVVGLVKCQSTA